MECCTGLIVIGGDSLLTAMVRNSSPIQVKQINKFRTGVNDTAGEEGAGRNSSSVQSLTPAKEQNRN